MSQSRARLGRPPPPPLPPSGFRGPSIKVRRFGRNDFERFDQEAARGSHICVGSANIGKVDIDCKYHWKKTQWGVLGTDRRPAGIVYMDVTFRQPHGYWLECASVFVTLSEDASSYALLPSGPTRRSTLGADYAVQITEYYGPRFLTGTRTIRAENRSLKLTPTVGANGLDIGGVGFESSSSQEIVGRWTFRGSVGKPCGGDGLRTLEWELRENVLDPDQAHSQEYHTAFTFEHSRRPVYMRVEVQGKLRSKSRQLKHDLRRFSSHLGKKDCSTLTLIEVSRDPAPYDRRLDHLAQGLDLAMQMQNLQHGPVQIPDPMTASRG
ncbi:hypothetical protein CDD83_5076 [Cordyceps sp. RAO-2017]|nr:hypothetical protein CDD83_5076 [Cordyceps sp. RAO-2017]